MYICCLLLLLVIFYNSCFKFSILKFLEGGKTSNKYCALMYFFTHRPMFVYCLFVMTVRNVFELWGCTLMKKVIILISTDIIRNHEQQSTNCNKNIKSTPNIKFIMLMVLVSVFVVILMTYIAVLIIEKHKKINGDQEHRNQS